MACLLAPLVLSLLLIGSSASPLSPGKKIDEAAIFLCEAQTDAALLQVVTV